MFVISEETCENCKGLGQKRGTGKHPYHCAECRGTGRKLIRLEDALKCIERQQPPWTHIRLEHL